MPREAVLPSRPDPQQSLGKEDKGQRGCNWIFIWEEAYRTWPALAPRSYKCEPKEAHGTVPLHPLQVSVFPAQTDLGGPHPFYLLTLTQQSPPKATQADLPQLREGPRGSGLKEKKKLY